ncbi:ubiquitin protein ligase [Malassezia pachydermatis]
MPTSMPPDPEDVLRAEQSLLLRPLDELRTSLKHQQRLSDRDLEHAKQTLSHVLSSATTEERMRTLRGAVQKLSSLRSKLEDAKKNDALLFEALQARLQHMQALYHMDPASSDFSHWCDTRLDRLLVDHMLRQGYMHTAKALAQRQHIESLVDLPAFEQIHQIEMSLLGDEAKGQKPSCALALAWCAENRAALRKMGSTLEQELRIQEFIEYIQAGTPSSRIQAIQYARKYLAAHLPASTSPSGSSTLLRAMGLLACGPRRPCYQDLLSFDRWEALRRQFRTTSLALHNIPTIPLLYMALSAGLSSLHTVSMSAEALHCPMEEDNSSADMESSVNSHLFSSILLHRGEMNPDCPACQKDNLGVLTSHVSHNHPTQSTLICRVTGKPMDDKNPPMCLPNGMVYSTEALSILRSRSLDREIIVCPRTGQQFPYASCRKLFIS